MNDSNDERIIDSFLEEMLTNQHPPDLTEQIQARLRAELGPERFQQLRAGRLGNKPGSVVKLGMVVAGTAPSHGTTKSAAAESRGAFLTGWTSFSVAALTLAAGLMLAFALWKNWPGSSDAAAESLANNASSQSTSSTSAKPQPAATATAAAPKAKELPLPFDQLPFDAVPLGADAPFPEVASRPPAAAPVAALDDKAIIQSLNERFAKLWESQGISTTDELDKDRWMGQVAARLSGSSLSALKSDSPQELSEKLVRTGAFAELFADRIANYWLQGTAEADPKHPGAQALRGYLAQQIVAKKPWNEVLASLINSRDDEPQSVWLASLAGGGNHRLAGRIGSMMLDEALACARCHDASDNGRIVSMDQDDYWSLVAIFTGVDQQVTNPEAAAPVTHRLVDNQQHLFEGTKLPGVYFDRPDGRVQAARYRLPSGDDWRTMESVQTPRQSLARWIERSSITDQASVNLAWRLVFGRPLVAQHAALDGEGYSQRREILAMLAEQFQAHNRDIGQLVTWFVSSRPFAREVLAVDRSRWLAASEDEIMHWNNAAANFAVRLPDETSGMSLRSMESALARIDKWSSTPDSRRTTLAQPSPSSNLKPNVVAKTTDGEPRVGYLIHSVKPNYAQSLFINRLAKSKLSWPQQVDHVAGLVGESAGNELLHSQAQKILEAKNGDRAAALFQLLQGALLCHESM